MLRLIRTNRRSPGSAAVREPGPWHVRQNSFSDLTWCGKRQKRVRLGRALAYRGR